MKALRCLLLSMGLFGCFALTAQTTNTPVEPMDWLEGTWDVTYQDAALGPIQAQASARVENDGWINIRYVVTDPRDGSSIEFAPFNIRYKTNVLTMELFGKSPSAALSYEGGAIEAPPADAVVVTAPSGINLRASLDTVVTETPVHPVTAEAGIRLRLERKGTRLEGQWTVLRQPVTGFQGARSGTRGTQVTVAPEPIGEVRTDIMTGTETWEAAVITITNAWRADWKSAPASDRVVSGTAKVHINGRNLPTVVGRKADITFTDKTLHPDNTNAVGNILLPVIVDKAAVPGLKSFLLKDPGTKRQANGIWLFNWPSFYVKSIHFARKTHSDRYEPTSTLFHGEQFYVEAEPEAEVPGDSRLFGLRSDAPEPVYFHLQRDPQKRSIFRGGPFLLLDPEEDKPTGSVEGDELTLDATALIPTTLQNPLIIRAAQGARVQAGIVSTVLGESMSVATAEVVPSDEGDGPFPRALRLAKHFRTQFPDEDRYNIARFHPIGGYARTHVTAQDHAALILLHEELLNQVRKMRSLHSRVFTEKERREYQKLLGEASARRAEEPMFYTDVSKPDGNGTWRMNLAVYEKTLQESFGTNLLKRNEYLDLVLSQASSQMMSNLASAAVRLSAVDISQPEELLKVVKPGYSQAVYPLTSRLVRRSTAADTDLGNVRWVPDQTGRAAVQGISDFIGAIRADEELARYEWGWIARVTAPLAIFSMFGYGGAAVIVGDIALFGAGTAYHAAEAWDTSQQKDTAWALAPVIGYETYRELRRKLINDAPSLVLDGAMTLVGAASVRAQLAAARVHPPMQSMQNAVAQAMENGVESLSAEARIDFAYALDSAVQKAIKEGSDSLTVMERNALKANFPDGLPKDIASELRITPDNPNFVINLDESTLRASSPTRLEPPPVAPRETPPAVRPDPSNPVAAVNEPNPVLERLFDDALVRARNGEASARDDIKRIQFVDSNWSDLRPRERQAVTEAHELFLRMREADPSLKSLSELEAMNRFTKFGAQVHTGGISRTATAEELVADYLAHMNRVPSPDVLANAARISPEKAEALLFQASQDARPLNPKPFVAEPAQPRVSDPNAETVDAPRVPVTEEPRISPNDVLPQDPRRIEIAERLKAMGVEPRRAEFAGAVPAERPVDARVGAAAAAMQEGVSGRRVMDQLQWPREKLEPMLDDYLRRFDPATDAQRREMLRRFFGDDITSVEPRLQPPPPPTDPTSPRNSNPPPGLNPASTSGKSPREQVNDALSRMGVPPEAIKQLDTETVLNRVNNNPNEAAAGLSRRMEVDSKTAARAMGVDDTKFAGMLDNYEAAARPSTTPAERASEIANRLRSDGVTQPYTKILDARQERIDAALRDVGIPNGDPKLTASGLDPESAIIGQALERGVSPEDLMARRGMTRERLEYHADDYLLNGRNVENGAERARHRTELLTRSPLTGTPDGSTIRIPARVIAAEEELAEALQRIGVDRAMAEERARNLANLARNDAHEAIVVGAWQSRTPPAAVRQQFGLTDGQMARSLDHYLEKYLGMRDPSMRANYIAQNFFGRAGESVTPIQVRDLVSSAPSNSQPLRAHTTANPSPAPAASRAPLSQPSPAANVPANLDQRFGPAQKPAWIRAEEELPSGGVRPNRAVAEVTPNRPLALDPDHNYNWLIDENGRLLMAPEQFAIDDAGRLVMKEDGLTPGRLGHPSLINGAPARIAGELRCINGRWTINNLSGRYSLSNRGIRPEHLNNVAARFEEAGLGVVPHFHQPIF